MNQNKNDNDVSKDIDSDEEQKPIITFDKLSYPLDDEDDKKRKIDICLEVIVKLTKFCHGIMIGGVVRDYFILGHAAKDIDLRFPSLDDIERFFSLLKTIQKVTVIESYQNKSRTLFVKRCRIAFEFSNCICSFDVDITTKKNHSSIDYDFIANGITYDGEKFSFINNNDPSMLELALSHIEQKVMVPNPSLLIPSEQNKRRRECYLYRMSKFIERGWLIHDYDIILKAIQE